MKILAFAIAGCLCFAAARADDQPDAATKKEQIRLEGAWKISKAKHAGEAVEESEPTEFEFKGNRLIVRKGGRAPIILMFRLDLSANPKVIDWTVDPKGDFKDADKLAEGIYQLEGDTLIVCYNVRDNRFAKGNRPTEFKSGAGSDSMLVVLKRLKK